MWRFCDDDDDGDDSDDDGDGDDGDDDDDDDGDDDGGDDDGGDDDNEVPLGEMAKLSVFSLPFWGILACLLSRYALLSSSCLRVRISFALSFLAFSCLVLNSYYLPSPFSITLYASSASYASYTYKLPSPPSSAIDLHYPQKK